MKKDVGGKILKLGTDLSSAGQQKCQFQNQAGSRQPTTNSITATTCEIGCNTHYTVNMSCLL